MPAHARTHQGPPVWASPSEIMRADFLALRCAALRCVALRCAAQCGAARPVCARLQAVPYLGMHWKQFAEFKLFFSTAWDVAFKLIMNFGETAITCSLWHTDIKVVYSLFASLSLSLISLSLSLSLPHSVSLSLYLLPSPALSPRLSIPLSRSHPPLIIHLVKVFLFYLPLISSGKSYWSHCRMRKLHLANGVQLFIRFNQWEIVFQFLNENSCFGFACIRYVLVKLIILTLINSMSCQLYTVLQGFFQDEPKI